jgi:heterodisulfide reductase subunit A
VWNLSDKADQKNNNDEKPVVGVFVCRWGINIAGILDVPKIVEEIGKLPNVYSYEYLNMCTSGGAEYIKEQIEEKGFNRIVVAAWTPLTHEPVFHGILREAGIPQRYLEFTNIREHCSYVHQAQEIRDKATLKAIELIKAGISRAQLLEDIPTKIVPVNPTALVIGGGIAGLSSAIDLGDAGYKVYLVEKNTTIGGRMSQLDRTFPTDDCSIWILGPKMLEADRHENIEILSYSEVINVEGYIGNFRVKVKRKQRFVNEQLCTGCGSCTEVCPIYVPNYFDENLSARKCIDIAFAQAVPAISNIERDSCVECFACVDACDTEAIDFSQEEEIVELEVGTIIVATGWDLYQGDDYGYGTYENVITQIQLERILAPNGPTLGHLMRPSDRRRPKRVLFINCVGSRDLKTHEYCSVVCCNLSVKNSKLIMSEYPDSEIMVSYIDMRCGGKMYEEYYRRARNAGIVFVKGLIGNIEEDPETKNLKVQFEPVGTDAIMEMEFDMVVLSSASLPSQGTNQIASVMNIEKTPDGFLKEVHARLDPINTKVPGIYLAGSCQGQKSIDLAVSQAKGAASTAGIPMKNEKYVMELIRAQPIEERCAKCFKCIEACPYGAISINENRLIQVDIIKCRGCGICEATCPSKAIELAHYKDNQYVAYIDELLPIEE